jgi:beta-lactam-binding protein with PASTA domain
MPWLRAIFSRRFFFHLLASVLTVIMVLGLTYKWLASYTRHGSTITVPDVRGLRLEEVEHFLQNKSLRYKVSDSTAYDPDRPPGTVLEQDPEPGARVKEKRTIYLSITRSVAPRVKMPSLVDVSFRQAEAILQSYGLKTGKITYQPDLCRNCVLRCEIGGRTVTAGQEIRKGTVVDLILGDGFGTSRIPVPSLTGLTLEEALFVIRGSLLNSGAVVADATVRDTLNAYVVRQSPDADGGTISPGEAIDLYISKSPPRED